MKKTTLHNNIIANINPHYTNDYYKTARLVWGSQDVKVWDYSDRIVQWFGHEIVDKAWRAAKDEGLTPNSPAFIQHYLQIVYKDEGLELIGVMAGHNLATGYPYQVYGYKVSK